MPIVLETTSGPDSQTTIDANSTSVVTKPSGMGTGDVWVIIGQGWWLNLLSGWTRVIDYAQGGSLFYRVCDGSEGSSASWATYASTVWFSLRLSGVDNTTPMDVTAVSSTSSYTTTPAVPSLTTVTDGAFVLTTIMRSFMDGSNSLAYPSGFTGIFGASTAISSDTWRLASAYKLQTPAGSIGSPTWTWGGESWLRYTAAFRPAAGASAKARPIFRNPIRVWRV